MTDMTAIGCRRMWAATMLMILADYNKRHARALPIKRSEVLTDARLYLLSRDGREVAALAGMEIPIGHALELIASSRAVFKARTHVTGDRWTEDAA